MRSLTIGLLGVAAVLCTAFTQPADVQQRHDATAQRAQPDTYLVLSLRGERGPARSVVLTCGPDAGTHPRFLTACAALRQAGGDFDRLPAEPRDCRMIYTPVHAEAHGHWHGASVDHTTSYPNGCVAGARSGGVFDF